MKRFYVWYRPDFDTIHLFETCETFISHIDYTEGVITYKDESPEYFGYVKIGFFGYEDDL